MTGETRAMAENSPHMEAFRAKGYEVLILTDPIDEMWVDAIGEYRGTPIQAITKGDLDLAEPAVDDERFAGLLSWLGEVLGDQVKQVRLSSRLTTSPACLVGDEHDLSPTLEKMYRAMGQELPPVQRILEVNPTHSLITALHAAHADRGPGSELAETAELVYGVALLAEGGELTDPTRFLTLVLGRAEQTL
jgi:molecular chaperone HtpG